MAYRHSYHLPGTREIIGRAGFKTQTAAIEFPAVIAAGKAAGSGNVIQPYITYAVCGEYRNEAYNAIGSKKIEAYNI